MRPIDQSLQSSSPFFLDQSSLIVEMSDISFEELFCIGWIVILFLRFSYVRFNAWPWWCSW